MASRLLAFTKSINIQCNNKFLKDIYNHYNIINYRDWGLLVILNILQLITTPWYDFTTLFILIYSILFSAMSVYLMLLYLYCN